MFSHLYRRNVFCKAVYWRQKRKAIWLQLMFVYLRPTERKRVTTVRLFFLLQFLLCCCRSSQVWPEARTARCEKLLDHTHTLQTPGRRRPPQGCWLYQQCHLIFPGYRGSYQTPQQTWDHHKLTRALGGGRWSTGSHTDWDISVHMGRHAYCTLAMKTVSFTGHSELTSLQT